MSETRERTLHELTEDECWELAGAHVVGRLSVAGDGDDPPVIFPVNYAVDGRSIVFRSATGTKLALLRNHPVAFEIDHLDIPGATGWSVLLRGHAHELTHWESEHLDIATWAPGTRSHVVRVVPEAITGRRITPDTWLDPAGYL